MKRITIISLVAAGVLAAMLFAGCGPSEPFNAEQVSITVERGDVLHGTLLIPNGVEEPPVVLLIAGQGPTNRDGNQTGLFNNSLRFLAEELALRGVATLRYDKRCVGQSPCSLSENELSIDIFANDAAAWITKLRTDPRMGRVFVAGHAKGALVGMMACAKVPAEGFVSIGGAGVTADEILLEQMSGLPADKLAEARSILSRLAAGEEVGEVHGALSAMFRINIQPFMRSWITKDPQKLVAALDMPVMLAHGSNDLQISPRNLGLLAAARPDARVEAIEGMNYVLKLSATDAAENARTYNDPQIPVSDRLVEVVADFVGAAR